MDAQTQKGFEDLEDLGPAFRDIIEKLEKDGRVLRKSKLLSTEARKQGNELYSTKSTGHNSKIHTDILSQYSKSIAFAPTDSEELPLGYSNRAVLLMHLHRYKDSLVDIERALELSKDDEFKKRILARKERCLKLIDEENLRESAKNLTLTDDHDLENLASELKNFKPSATVPCASDSVELAYNDTFGRHLVAARDIEPGEIVIVEEGQVCYPTLNQTYLVCSHCLQTAWNGIPCDDCVFTIYCSEACKNEARDEYHDIECPLIKYMDCTVFNSERNGYDRMATVRLLIRALKKEGYENVMQEVLKDGKEENLDTLLSDGILQSNKFKSYYNLLSHAEAFGTEMKYNYEFLTSQIVYLLIEHTDFLVSLIGKDSSDKDNTLDQDGAIKLKEVLTKLKYITIANGYLFQKTPWQCGCNNLSECEEKCDLMKGILIVPCCSLLNHSCTPNVSHLFAPKRKVIVFSTSPIRKGEQLFDSYGISLLTGDLKVREDRLKELHFTCNCKACLDKIDISTVPDMSKEDSAKIVAEFTECFPKAMESSVLTGSQENGKMSEALQYVKKMSQLYHKHFNYYEAYKYSFKSQTFIKKIMSKLYEEKSSIPNDC